MILNGRYRISDAPKINAGPSKKRRAITQVEGLRGQMAESTRGVEGLFEGWLAEAFA